MPMRSGPWAGRPCPCWLTWGIRCSWKKLLKDALAEYGHIDVVVNNAATRPHKPFVEMSYEDWRGVLATDLDSAFLCTKAALPGMIDRHWGRVVNISGLQAFQEEVMAAPTYPPPK